METENKSLSCIMKEIESWNLNHRHVCENCKNSYLYTGEECPYAGTECLYGTCHGWKQREVCPHEKAMTGDRCNSFLSNDCRYVHIAKNRLLTMCGKTHKY